jgi:protein required for attachment to host cells
VSIEDISPFINISSTAGVNASKQTDNQNHHSKRRHSHKSGKHETDSVEISSTELQSESEAESPENDERLVDDSSISGAFIDIKI